MKKKDKKLLESTYYRIFMDFRSDYGKFEMGEAVAAFVEDKFIKQLRMMKPAKYEKVPVRCYASKDKSEVYFQLGRNQLPLESGIKWLYKGIENKEGFDNDAKRIVSEVYQMCE